MTIYIQTTAQSELTVGTPLVLEGFAPAGKFGAVFEDDGDTGYFYAIDPSDKKQPIQDALHIYDVHAVADREIPSRVQIGWSPDGTAVLLAINGSIHAVFNFSTKEACCRNGFPPADGGEWGVGGHQWREEMLRAFAQES